MSISCALALLALAGTRSKSLHFTRRDQVVFVPYQKPMDVIGELTMEAWVFPERDPRARFYHWVLSRNYGPGGYGLVLEGRDSLAIGGTQELVPFDTWSHIAVVLGKRAEKVYVNGELAFVASGDHRVKARPTLPLWIGNSNFGGAETTEFTGRIAEIRIWSVGLGQDQIRRNMNHYLRGNERGLVAYFPLCEGKGFIAHDFTGHLMAGRLGDSYRANVNAPEWDQGPPMVGPLPKRLKQR
ncbi:MAG: LamG domain-containing protein [Fimbriimonadaceae bacterium]